MSHSFFRVPVSVCVYICFVVNQVPVLSLVTGIFPSSLAQLTDIVNFNIGETFLNIDGLPADPVTYKMTTDFIDRLLSGHILSPEGRQLPLLTASFITRLTTDFPGAAEVQVVVDDWRPGLRSFRLRSSGITGIPSPPVCYADTKITVPNIFLCSGTLGGFVYNHITKAYDLLDPIVPNCPVVHVTNRLLLPATCNVFPTVEEIVCAEPNLALYCAAYLLVEADLGLDALVNDEESTTFLAPTNFAFTQAFIALGIFSPLVVNKLDYISLENIVLIERIIQYNTLGNAPLPSCAPDLPSPKTFHSLLDFKVGEETGTFWPVTFERRSALERLCGGTIYGKFLFERVVFIGQLNTATALVDGISACNQNYVYITDAVLLPPDLFSERTVLDILEAASQVPGSRYTIFYAFVLRSNQFDLYAGIGQGTLDGGFTSIVPTDRGIRDTILYLKIGSRPYALSGLLEDQDQEIVDQFVGYHTLVDGTFYFATLLTQNGNSFDTALTTRSDPNLITVIVLGTFPHEIIQLEGKCSSANVVKIISDQAAINGIVHFLDGALTPEKYCRKVCELIELNPLTNVFIALIYALGLEKDLCTLGCSTGNATKGKATFLVPTDVAFTAVFAYLGLPQNTIFDFPALLYDIVLYHVIPGAAVLSTALATGSVATPILGRYTLDNDQFPQVEFIRVDTVDIQGWHITTLYVQGQEFENPPARVIIPDQIGTDGIVHTINRVLLPSTERTCKIPNVVYVDGECDDIPCTITGLFPSFKTISIESTVTYVPDPTCIPWCLSWWCFPCTPRVAQPIVTIGGVNGSFTASVFDDPLGAFLNLLNRGNVLGGLALYINQVGELRFGVSSYFDEALARGPHKTLDFTTAPSIFASGFTAFPFQTYKILATYSEPCKLAKIYVNDIIRAIATINFSVSSFTEEFVIIGGSNPLVRTRPGLPPITADDVSGQFTKDGLEQPYPDGKVPIFYNPYGFMGGPDVLTLGPGPFNFELNEAIDFDYTAEAATLINGQIGWSRIEGDLVPDYLTHSAYFENCASPKYHQCTTTDPKNACCGLSAHDFREWLGLIAYVYIYDVITYPSACTYPRFLPTPIPGRGPQDFPEVEIEVPADARLAPGEEVIADGPDGERVVVTTDPFDDLNLSNPLDGGGVLNPFEP